VNHYRKPKIIKCTSNPILNEMRLISSQRKGQVTGHHGEHPH
jgi:hypothetical protein